MSDDQNVEAEEDRELPEIDPASLDLDGDEDGADELEPIVIENERVALVEDVGTKPGESKIQALGQGTLHAEATDFKREVNITGDGATRCKLFHSKISAVPLEYMEKQVNEWLDQRDVEVKFVSKVVGVMEGKRPEPNVILTIWY